MKRNKWGQRLYKRTCADCGVEEWVRKSQLHKLCALCCKTGERSHRYGVRGHNHPSWKGGFSLSTEGYMLIHTGLIDGWNNNRRYIGRHEYVLGWKLGRLPKKGEATHHINGKRDDDRPENLWLFPTRAEHTAWHEWLKKREKV